ncbi:helix-turn-helix domain-containing protein [Streptococcus parauberis]|uniref:helix-turn-helix domain-containing protein n=1 Tax=Streptococcus parauberis TaxID=1348 RepID=UPI000C3579CF|nr:helix-turn-helix transcriptional regulator [Streptococcus parauberis]PIA83742.1 helix-turn-helix protein [Streptococcus parauberis]
MHKIKEERKNRKWSQDKLAEEYNKKFKNDDDFKPISKMTISNLENGKHELKIGVAEKFSDLFDVQLSYLLGFTDVRTMQEEVSIMMDEFNSDFIRFLKKHEIFLSDNQIETTVQTMYSMSNVNMQYLGKLSRDRDLKEMELLKNSMFSQVFEYSSMWSNNYKSLKLFYESGPDTPFEPRS